MSAPEQIDKITHALEKGARARRLQADGVGKDLDERRARIWRQAENDLRAGKLDGNLAMIHIACSNALRAYEEELEGDIAKAERAAEKLHAEPDEPADGDE